ncbi:MAG: hypothetical protein HRU40_08015 [Saprospiraceae bacterium]|nr:hypothetical protein [Saprospiraceae bacterium]
MRIIILSVGVLLLISCEETQLVDENVFEFKLNNSYTIVDTNEEYETANGFEALNNNFLNVVLTDGAINEELNVPCCDYKVWDYEINPSTYVSIEFAKKKDELTPGVYTFERNAKDNDFVIRIFNQIVFNEKNELLEYNTVAYNHHTLNEEGIIQKAQLELFFGELSVVLNYSIQTVDNKNITGFFTGPLERFSYNYCYYDCD